MVTAHPTRQLRHGLNYLCPSEIADQFYCEYKVHLKRLHPEVRIELPALEHGETNHAVLVRQAKPVTHAEIEQSIRAGKPLAICEWMMEGRYQDVWIRGRPDFFAFEGKTALLLLDFKFSGAQRPFRDHEVQVEVYGLLSQSMGFSTEQLWLGIVMLPPVGGAHDPETSLLTKSSRLACFNADGTLHQIYERCQQKTKTLVARGFARTKVESERWTAYLFRFDPSRATQDLSWALQCWLSERDPLPEKRYPRKCSACPLNALGLCEHALGPPNGTYPVQGHDEGGTIVRGEPHRRAVS